MTLKALAEVSALELRLGLEIGSLQGADLARANASLEDASSLVRAEAGKPWLDGNTVTAPAQVVTIVIKAALREYKNPDGFSSEQIGDYSYRTDNVGGVYLTEDERRIVRMAAGTGGAGMGTIRTPSEYYDPTTPLPDDYYMGDLD
jgi:hypothetical protein